MALTNREFCRCVMHVSEADSYSTRSWTRSSYRTLDCWSTWNPFKMHNKTTFFVQQMIWRIMPLRLTYLKA